MPQLTLSEWSAIAQVAATLIGLAGVVISVWIGISTLREVQHDRKLRHRPYLAFEYGGHRIPVEFLAGGPFVPGVSRAYAEKALASLPPKGESVVILRAPGTAGRAKPVFYGHLRNYGAGAALSTEVTWVAERIWIGEESFVLDNAKMQEPLYAAPLNTMPTIPSHIEPGAEAQLSRLPAFVVKDYDKKVTQVDGHLMIRSADLFGAKYIVQQAYHLFCDYKESPPSVHVTFSDLITAEGAA